MKFEKGETRDENDTQISKFIKPAFWKEKSQSIYFELNAHFSECIQGEILLDVMSVRLENFP